MPRTQLWQDLNTDTDASIQCQNCGAPVLPGDKFCTSCGKPVKVQANTPVPQTNQDLGSDRLCLGCGEPLVPGDKFCTICGRPVPVEAEPPSTTNEPLEEKPVGFCTHCGNPLYPGDLFCTNCSAPVSAEEPHDTDGPEKAAPIEPILPPVSGTTALKKPVSDMSAPQPDYPSSIPTYEDDDDPTVRSQLLTITLEEARNGCTKKLRLSDGTEVQIDVPAGANPGTKVDVPGKGIVDKTTGRRGPLRVSFYIMR